MSRNDDERDIARSLGFGGRKPRLPFESGLSSRQSRHPIAGKLGIRPGTRTLLVGVKDPGIAGVRSAASGRTTSFVPRDPVDVVVFQAESAFALRRVPEVAGCVRVGGVLWLLWPHDERHIAESHVRSAGVASGLKDVLTTEVTPALRGMKLVKVRRDR